MSVLGFILMTLFTIIGIKYLVDMIKYALGYEINGKCRYGKKYARQLENRKKEIVRKTNDNICNDSEIHNDITRLISTISA